MSGKLKLDETSVAKIIEIAMSNNEKCKTCEFRGVYRYIVRLQHRQLFI